MSEQNQNPSNKETLEAIEKFKRSKKNPNVDKSSVISDQPVMQQQKIQQMYDPQQQRETDPDLISAFEMITLPSHGIHYQSGISEVMVEFLTTEDEDVLSTSSLIQNGTVLDVLLRRKIKTKGINVEDLLPGDKDAILLFLRMSSYGNEYDVEVMNPYTNLPFKTKIDLRKLKYKEVTEKPDNMGYYSVLLPMRNKLVKFKLLKASEEVTVNKTAEALKEAYNQDYALYNTMKLKAHVISIGDRVDRSYIDKFISSMPAKDALTLRKKILEVSPGIDMNYEFIDPNGNKFISKVFINVDFFFPQN